jgi:hypothetical protein
MSVVLFGDARMTEGIEDANAAKRTAAIAIFTAFFIV